VVKSWNRALEVGFDFETFSLGWLCGDWVILIGWSCDIFACADVQQGVDTTCRRLGSARFASAYYVPNQRGASDVPTPRSRGALMMPQVTVQILGVPLRCL
jgi:hypothetical protein